MQPRTLLGASICALIVGNLYFQAKGIGSLLYARILGCSSHLPEPPQRRAAPPRAFERPTAARGALPTSSASAAISAVPRAAPASPPAALSRRDWIGRVRAGAHVVDGRTVGIRISNVHQQSLQTSIGQQSGDVLLSINDHALTDPRSAIEAYAALREARDLELWILRDDAPRRFVYHVR
jgi:hypothetical protein